MKLEEAKVADLEKIITIHDRLFELKYSYDNYLSELSLDIANFMILRDEEEVVGYFITHSVFEQLEIVIIALQPQYQGLGYGKLFLEYIEYLKQKNHCAEIMIEVLETNEQALKFYEKNNFKKFGMRQDYYGKNKNALLYRR